MGDSGMVHAFVGCAARGDVSTVAEHRQAVGDLKNLVQAVSYVDDRYPAFLQHADLLEENFDLPPGQDRRRLVEHQYAHILARQGAQDRD